MCNKFAHGISTLIDCTTSEQVSHKREYGLWENKNHTQIHFETVCQNAIAESHTLNEARSHTTHSYSNFIQESTNANDPQQFNASNAAEKLKKFFSKDFFEESSRKNETTTDVPIPDNVTLSVHSFGMV